VKRRVRRELTDHEREEHIQTLERLGRLVVELPCTPPPLRRAFVMFIYE
jgi:hypothetical protein